MEEQQVKNLENDFKKITQYYSKHHDHIQAGGGNTSVKGENLMLIKASGYTLKEAAKQQGFVALQYKKLKSFFLEKENISESDYDSFLYSISFNNDKKASMESGFHAILKQKYVLHTHSIWVNMLSTSKQGQSILYSLFSNDDNIVFIPYITPGIPLSQAIAKEKSTASIFILEQHGIIAQDDNLDNLIQKYENIHKKIFDSIPIKIPPYPNAEVILNEKKIFQSCTKMPIKITQECLFSEKLNSIILPDQAVYFSLNKQYSFTEGLLTYSDNLKKALFLEEIAISISFILSIHQQLNWNTLYIDPQKIKKLLGLKSEKHRQS